MAGDDLSTSDPEMLQDSQDELKEATSTPIEKLAAACSGSLQPPENSYQYRLVGSQMVPQVEPTAGSWLRKHKICVPDLEAVVGYVEGTEESKSEPSCVRVDRSRFMLAATDFPSSDARLKAQLTVLEALASLRDEYPYPAGTSFGAGADGLTIAPLSRFLQLQPPPFGAIFDVVAHPTTGIGRGEVNRQRTRVLEPSGLSRDGQDRIRVINQGMELARAFENETPGLYHRHALNWLLFDRFDISPPRHARIWLALEMAIYTALDAAWHYKWEHPRYSQLLRPAEYARRCQGERLNVLFDRGVDNNGREARAMPRPNPVPQVRGDGGDPGTPRHPAWPSGHSTYSAAASYILEYFFSPETIHLPDDDDVFRDPQLDVAIIAPRSAENNRLRGIWAARELRRLADNIGEARLWAGVHWISDHIAGQKIGRAAAQAVLDEFCEDCIVPHRSAFAGDQPSGQQPIPQPPPSRQDARDDGNASRACEGEASGGKHDKIDPPVPPFSDDPAQPGFRTLSVPT